MGLRRGVGGWREGGTGRPESQAAWHSRGREAQRNPEIQVRNRRADRPDGAEQRGGPLSGADSALRRGRLRSQTIVCNAQRSFQH